MNQSAFAAFLVQTIIVDLDFNGNFSTSGRVTSCKVSPEVWLSTLGQTSDPSLAWKKSDVFKIKDDDELMIVLFFYFLVSVYVCFISFSFCSQSLWYE